MNRIEQNRIEQNATQQNRIEGAEESDQDGGESGRVEL